MWEIFLKILPFFALIGLGYISGRTRFFTEDATAYLTKFVFYFALSAMLFKFSATLDIAELLDPTIIIAYLTATAAVYILATAVAMFRGIGMAEGAIEAQCAVIGNVGFLGIPMLSLIFGADAARPIIIMLTCDLIVFSSLIVILITISKQGRVSPAIFGTVLLGILKNPMIMSIALGILWSSWSLPVPAPVDEFLTLLGAAATPAALFAIGASLATKSAERASVALWLTFAKLVLHPAAVFITVMIVWPVEPFAAGIMVIAAALPVAGNIFILAHHYGVAPQRVSSAILVSTVVSVATVAAVITWINPA